MASIKARLLYLAALPVFCALLLELSLRFIFIFLPNDIKAYQAWIGIFEGDPFVAYVAHPGYTLSHNRGTYSPATKNFTAPSRVTVNSRGFRGKEFSPKKALGAYRVFCLGGSDTWGFGVNDDQAWPALLEEQLRAAAPGRAIEVINAGVGGYTSFHSLANLYSRLLDYEPDLVVVYHSWNDLKYMPYVSQSRRFGEMDLAGLYKIPWWAYVRARSYAWTLAGAALRKYSTNTSSDESYAGDSKANSDLSHGLEVFRRNLTGIVAIARANHVGVVLANPLRLVKDSNSPAERAKIANGLIGLSQDDLRVAFKRIDKVLASVAAAEGAPYVDLNQVVPVSLETLSDHIHPTPKGHALIAQALAPKIRAGISKAGAR